MTLLLFFAVVLILTFAVLLYFLKPTSMEKAVAEQLADIEVSDTALTRPTTILKEEVVHSIPLLDDLIRRIPWSPATARLIKQAGKRWSVSSVLGISLLAALAGGWASLLVASDIVIALCIGFVAALLPYVCLYILREARFRKFDSLLPEAVDLMSRGLRAGHSIAAVMEMVGDEISDPVGTEFRALHKEQSLGLPVREAIMNFVERVPIDDVRFLATAILLQKESGGNLVQILDKTIGGAAGTCAAARPAQNLHRPGPDHRMDPLFRAIPDVWFDQHYEPSVRGDSLHRSVRPQDGLHRLGADGRGHSADPQNY